MFAPAYLVVLLLAAGALSAPTRIRKTDIEPDQVEDFLLSLCINTPCLYGPASFDLDYSVCVCPTEPGDIFHNPCLDIVCPDDLEPFYSFVQEECFCDIDEDITDLRLAVQTDTRQQLARRSLELSTTPPTSPPMDTTFIPPPKDNLTLELLKQSLEIQPQRQATVAAVVPHFREGHISFYIQLQGMVTELLVMNASASLPCGAIGKTDPQPDLVIMPKSIKGATSQNVIADCLVMAVGVYRPDTITFWVSNGDGAIFSLASPNQVFYIDQIDFNQSPSLAVLPYSPNPKREVQLDSNFVHLERRQLYAVACDKPCPFYHMQKIGDSEGYCGCVFRGAQEELNFDRRGLEQPNAYTATMSPEVCAAITCINSGVESPARYNPFSRDCWCVSPLVAEVSNEKEDAD